MYKPANWPISSINRVCQEQREAAVLLISWTWPADQRAVDKATRVGKVEIAGTLVSKENMIMEVNPKVRDAYTYFHWPLRFHWPQRYWNLII